MADIVELSIEQASKMASIASNAHTHAMSQNLIESCFGGLYSVFGLTNENELLGFVIVHQIFEDATIIDICVEPYAQSKGYGRKLMEHAVSLAKSNRAEVVSLEVRASAETAMALYKRIGFIQTGVRKDYYPCDAGKEDALLMSLSL